MELPDAALRWILENAVTSNLEFFRLANVCSAFRRVIEEVILERVKENKKSSAVDSLLLPCMLRELVHNVSSQSLDRSDTFCAAWFHPDGIVEQIVSLREEEKEEDCESTGSHPSFAPGGEPNISDSSPEEDSRSRRSRGSYKQRQHRKTPTKRSRSPASRSLSERSQLSANEVRCCKEWRGFREPMQVLKHFEASKVFVDELVQAAQRCAAAATSASEEMVQDTVVSTLHPIIAKPTFAVRGATVARPDSYCFCRDAQEERELKAAQETKTTKDATSWEDIRQREYRQAIARMQRRRREDQRAVLPRVLLPSSANTHKPTTLTIPHTIQAVITKEDGMKDNGANNDDTYRATNRKPVNTHYSSLSDLFAPRINEEVPSHACLPPPSEPSSPNDPATLIGRHCRSVQFLNTDGSHAVCMTTPPFACGPLPLPLTFFCVGIATEDGCFLSGLHHRFELGHMYPNSAIAAITDLSPFSIATEPWNQLSPQVQTSDGNLLQKHSSSLDEFYDSSIESDGSSCDISDDDGTTTPHCECDYRKVVRKLDMTDRDDAATGMSILTGRLGPGTWHCYVVVVDTTETQIRIDGLAENVDDSLASETMGQAVLDGLTLGSDHQWAMSLCCGFGSGGEGEGAIAELAVFHGRLEHSDIEAIEQSMMQRHGIPRLEDLTTDVRSQDYDWMRQAQALFVQTPQAAVSFKGVPLRYMMRHRSVAWKQYNAVTGEAMIQQKIGARSGGESSDW